MILYGLFAQMLARFFYDDERKSSFSLPHRLARTAALFADYIALLIVALKLAERLTERICLDFAASCITVFFLLAAPLVLCLLKRKIHNPRLFFPLSAMFVAAADDKLKKKQIFGFGRPEFNLYDELFPTCA